MSKVPPADCEEKRSPISNVSQGVLPDSTGDVQTRMLNATLHMSDQMNAQMAGIQIRIAGTKSILRHGCPLLAVAENKKQPRITCTEDVLAKHFPGEKTASQKSTLIPSLFGGLELGVVKSYLPASMAIRRTKWILELMMLSTKDGKTVYDTDIGRDENAL